MSYDIYKKARDSAWKFLIDNRVNSLSVKLSAICHQNGISLLYDYSGEYLTQTEKGCTFIDAEKRLSIILNPNDKIEIQRYTIAHEFGHISMKHFTEKMIGKSEMEYQAERFAIDVLAPACVLWGLGLHNAKEISEVCDISMTAAQIRAERMKILYKRNVLLTSPLERRVFEQFSGFIKQYKLKRK